MAERHIERPPLWPVLPRPRMAGFEVSTEARITRTLRGARGLDLREFWASRTGVSLRSLLAGHELRRASENGLLLET